MLYPDTLDTARDRASAALQAMEEKGIPPTPANFTLWYAYQAGQNPDLTRDLDALADDGQEVTDDLSQDLYERHFGDRRAREAVEETSDRLLHTIGEVLATLNETNSDAAHYGERLASFSGQVSGDDLGGRLGPLIQGILEETQSVLSRTRSLEDRLNESTQEVDSLRRNLEQVQQEAMTDGLTGIANRKSFDNSLAKRLEQAGEGKTQLCLVMLDVDHFKRFNDSYGHRIGDEVLKLVARILTQTVSSSDLPARYGGEEFAVILPGRNLQDSIALADRIRQTLASRRLTNKATGESFGKVTVSLGISRLRPGESAATLIQRADEALYAAKRTGRNRVVDESRLPADVAAAD